MSSSLKGRVSEDVLSLTDDTFTIKSKSLGQSFTSSCQQFSLSSIGLFNVVGDDHNSIPQWLFDCLGDVVDISICMQRSQVNRQVRIVDIQVDTVESTWSVLGKVFIVEVKNAKV